MHGRHSKSWFTNCNQSVEILFTSQTLFVHAACISLATQRTSAKEATNIKKTKILAAMLVDNKITNKISQ